MSVLRPSRSQLTRALMLGAGAATLASLPALAAGRPSLHADHGCYKAKQPVRLHGTGFAPNRTYVLSVDGVYFGQSTTDARGDMSPPAILPGGLPAGYPQAIEHVEASDGTSIARTTFTLTRPAGARFLRTTGSGTAIRAPIEVWGYSLAGRRRRVYLHYVDPSGNPLRTAGIGRTGGQCGYLRSSRVRLFPFTPTRGTYVFQIDTRRHYARHPGGPMHRIAVTVH